MTDGEISENKWRRHAIRYAPLVLWTLVIFGFSTGAASMDETSRIIRPILKYLFPATPDNVINIYHGYVRKLAHFTEYSILAFFAFRAVRNSTIVFLRSWTLLVPVAIVIVVASLDEFHQSFVASRTSSGWDVLLDVSGGAVTAFSCWFFTKRLTRAR